jgi:hypothetical protein
MQVKNLALTATALVALGAAAAQADDVKPKYAVDVYINIFHTWSDDDPSLDVEESTAGLDGRVVMNVPFSEAGAMQWDLMGTTELGTRYDETDNFETLTGGFAFVSEINFRDGDGLLGGFIGAGSIGVLDDASAMFYLAGLEAQWFCDRWTFGVQLGAADGSSDDAYASEAVFVNGEVRYYVSKALRLRVNGGYLDGTAGGVAAVDDDVEIWWWGARGDYWVGQSIPTSVFAAVESFDAERESGSDNQFDEITLKLGIALHFGVTDQMDADRSGKANIHLDYIRMFHAGGPAID